MGGKVGLRELELLGRQTLLLPKIKGEEETVNLLDDRFVGSAMNRRQEGVTLLVDSFKGVHQAFSVTQRLPDCSESVERILQRSEIIRLCCTGLPSDVIIEIGEISFHLHKFPLLSRSGVLKNKIGDFSGDNEKKCVLQLHDIPGGAKVFLLVAKFCYGVKIELTGLNVVSLRCAAEYLQMNENYGEGNLVTQTENFLNEVFGNWSESIKALQSCEEVLPHAEELHIVSRCINSLAEKACSDPSLFSWSLSGDSAVQNPDGSFIWNGIRAAAKPTPMTEDWWYEDVSYLRLSMYKRLILTLGFKGIKPEKIAGSLMYYAKRYLSLTGRQSSFKNGNRVAPGSVVSSPSEVDQRILLEEIAELLPAQKGVTPTNFLLRLLRTAIILHASPSCQENLEKRVGAQLDQAVLEDLLIPNMGYSVETLYDIDCIQRILDQFMLVDRDATDCASTNFMADEGQLMEAPVPLTPLTMVANLVDGYLAEVAPDVNLKWTKFQSLAAGIPDYARPLDDGIYRAIDIYLKEHPWLTNSEREQICRLMNCQKLSLEASTHAAQNERLPLRVIVQVLFFEQLRLRTSIAGWFFVSDNPEKSHNPSGNLALTRNIGPVQEGASQGHIIAVDNVRERVSELEKECLSMKQELEKMVRTKGSWNVFCKKFGMGLKFQSQSRPSDPKKLESSNAKKASIPSSARRVNGKQTHVDLMG